MSLLKRLGTNGSQQPQEEESGLSRRLATPGGAAKPPASPPQEAEKKPAPPPPEEEGPRHTLVPSAPAEGGLMDRISAITPEKEEEEQLSFGHKVRKAPADPLIDFKFKVQDRVIAELGPRLNRTTQAEVRKTIEQALAGMISEAGMLLGPAERQRVSKEIEAEVWGYGPLQPLLDDDNITEIMANGPDHVYVEQNGKLKLSQVRFYDERHMLRVIDRILTPVGRRVDESSPMADARLPDGSRVNIVIPPLALNGPTITVRKFSHNEFGVEDLIRLGTISPEAALFLAGCVWARLNIIVAGGASSGKTTLLNIMSSFIPPDERIVTVETTAELSLWQDHVVPLEARPPNVEGKGEVDVRQLVINCLRMRPERIVVGECRGAEAIDMLQAMNTGHDGSLTTAHANSPADVISRMEVMCMMAGMNLPSKAIREQIASAVQLIVHMSRLQDGTRKVVQVTEIQGMEGDQIILQDVFIFEQKGTQNGKVVGQLRPTGFVPRCLDTLTGMNVHLPGTLFEPQGLGVTGPEQFKELLARFSRPAKETRFYKVDWSVLLGSTLTTEEGKAAQPLTGSLTERLGAGEAKPAQEEAKFFGHKVRKVPTDPLIDFKFKVQDRVIAELGPRLNKTTQAEIRKTIEQALAGMISEAGMLLGPAERQRVSKEIEAEVWGYGPLQPLLDSDNITEIMANGPDHVYVEQEGKLKLSQVRFYDERHMLRVIDRILSPVGRRVDESSPMADARLPDGSRVNIVIPPLALNGPTITVRKFSHNEFGVEDLIRLGTISPEAALFLAGCVWARLNIVVAGGASSGKTTLLNIMSSFIPPDERIVTVETTAELSLWQDHVVPLEARPPNVEGKGEVDVRQLVINCLRMRPERIVVGECRGAEAIDMLQAMNTGHDGSLTTAHANSPVDVVSRMEVMCMMAGMNLPSKAIREQIASAVQLIVHMSRLQDGTRKVTQVTEIQGMEGDQIILQDVFIFEQKGTQDGKVIGQLRPTGFVPRCLDTLTGMNVHLPGTLFEPQGLGVTGPEQFKELLARFSRPAKETRFYKVDWSVLLGSTLTTEEGKAAQPLTGSLTERLGAGEAKPAQEEAKFFGHKVRKAPSDPLIEFKFKVQDRVIAELGPRLNRTTQNEVRKTIEQALAGMVSEAGMLLGPAERQRVSKEIEAEVWGYGPLQPLLDDDNITEIMANGPDHVYVEQNGKLKLSQVRFYDERHMLRVIDRILTPVGRRVDESSPMADARLPDGSRVNVVIPPLALNGPTITVRKFSHNQFGADDLVRLGTVTQEVMQFLASCVRARLNIIVSGGASSGKTTLLNIVSSYIPADERIVTVETTAELSLWQDHVVPLEARPPNVEGKGEVDVRQLVINCLRMRPERIVVGECRGGEAIDMLQAMNTGHDGSLTTTHANSPVDVISRMEVMCMMAGMNLPSKAIREQIASAVQLIVHMGRQRDGTRKVTQVTEIQGMEGDQIILQDIFVFEQKGLQDGKIIGQLRPTGFVPRCLDTLAAMNEFLPTTIFQPQGAGGGPSLS